MAAGCGATSVILVNGGIIRERLVVAWLTGLRAGALAHISRTFRRVAGGLSEAYGILWLPTGWMRRLP